MLFSDKALLRQSSMLSTNDFDAASSEWAEVAELAEWALSTSTHYSIGPSESTDALEMVTPADLATKAAALLAPPLPVLRSWEPSLSMPPLRTFFHKNVTIGKLCVDGDNIEGPVRLPIGGEAYKDFTSWDAKSDEAIDDCLAQCVFHPQCAAIASWQRAHGKGLVRHRCVPYSACESTSSTVRASKHGECVFIL